MYSSDALFLSGLEGTEVTTDAKTPFLLPSQTWVIIEKLSGNAFPMTQKDLDDGLGPAAYTAAKFLCHRVDDPTKETAFMRIYLQIPIAGTELLNPGIRAKQAIPPLPHTELSTLKALKKMSCDVVPDLLGNQEGKQGHDGIVPGGFITYVVWDKVPGDSLTEDKFWNLDRQSRDAIRKEFRRVYE